MGSKHLARQAQVRRERVGDGHDSVWFEGRWFRTGELGDRAERIAAGLTRLGVQPGDRVAVVMANTPDVGVVYQACWHAGAVATPVIFLLPPPELQHIFSDAEVRAVVTTPEFLANVQQACTGIDAAIICTGQADGATHLEELAGSDPLDLVERADEDLAALMYTGGTTGRSKGVMLTHANLWHAGKAGYEASLDHRLHRTIVPLPLSHAFGLLVTVTGMHDPDPSCSVLMRWFEPQGFLELIDQHRMEQATVVPTMLRLLLAQPLEEHDLSTLTRVVCGSAPLPTNVLEAFEQRVPSATICEGYGLTETCGATTSNRLTNRRVGTVGQPLPGIDLRIVDDDGERLGQGEPGEVLIHSPTSAAGYWRSPEATAATFVDGWVHTGDIGTLDEDGFLRIVDRKKDLIIRNGFNVFPRDVEEGLQAHALVAAAGVVGRADDEVGEEVVAFVVPARDGLEPDELRVWAREHIGAKGYPREIHVVEQLPLTPVMKLDRKALRGWIDTQEQG